MKVNLTLQEKLRDLRSERKLKLQEVADTTGIPRTTIQRIETDDNIRANYQDVATLAKFYNVSADYLFGITDNLQHRNIEIDALSLSDSAIEVLKSKKLNNRMISDMLSHEGFQQSLRSVETYIDNNLLQQERIITHFNDLVQFYLGKEKRKDKHRAKIDSLLRYSGVESAMLNDQEWHIMFKLFMNREIMRKIDKQKRTQDGSQLKLAEKYKLRIEQKKLMAAKEQSPKTAHFD